MIRIYKINKKKLIQYVFFIVNDILLTLYNNNYSLQSLHLELGIWQTLLGSGPFLQVPFINDLLVKFAYACFLIQRARVHKSQREMKFVCADLKLFYLSLSACYFALKKELSLY
uniref:Uncharacterized protein n=1 Tax=Cacopsylla melanoneura TaxID=428564 RepID=A0A8D8UVS2_9HEMI